MSTAMQVQRSRRMLLCLHAVQVEAFLMRRQLTGREMRDLIPKVRCKMPESAQVQHLESSGYL